MDPITNPFSPGAGSPPPELVGRENIINQGKILFARVKQNRSEKSLLLTGLRGVGKTVLLIELEKIAITEGYHTIFIEAHENKPLGVSLAPSLRRLLFELDRLAGVGNKVRKGLAVLKGFINTIKIKWGDFELGLGIDAEQGVADSGDIEIDLPELFLAIGEAAEERKAAVAIFIDELQYFSSKELSGLIMAMHKMQQRQLPLVLIGAGLPILPALSGESKSYAERLFQFPLVGPLSKRDTIKALQDPVQLTGVQFTKEALNEIFHLTQGYPYFVQEWGYQSWNKAERSPITLQMIKETTPIVTRQLDEGFFRVRFDRLTPSEQSFLRIMAEMGPDSYRTSDIAEILGKNISAISPVRASLIQKGMIYSPSYGDMAFTVPLFDAFMKRAIPHLPK